MKFPGTLDALQEMLSWIRGKLLAAGFEKKVATKVELASEEALVNIIEHAYQKTPHPIEIAVHEEERSLTIAIRDCGPPFDPLQNVPVRDEQATGGLGILFMRKFVDEVHYRREGQCNLLTLVKYRP